MHRLGHRPTTPGHAADLAPAPAAKADPATDHQTNPHQVPS